METGENSIVALETSVQQFVNDQLKHLWENHAEWSAKHLGTKPTYSIPKPVVENTALGRLFSPTDLAAEKLFTECCEASNAIGIRENRWIKYEYLTQAPLSIPENVVEQFGWPRSASIIFKKLGSEIDQVADRLLGVAGRLITEPKFLDELEPLRTQWQALPEAGRPHFPLARPVDLRLPISEVRLTNESVVTFFENLARFLDRWGLISLVDWQLPEPQGPLVPNPLPLGSPAQPKHGVHIFLPMHYPLQGNDQLLRKIAQSQRQLAIQDDLPAGIAAIAHHELHAQMIRLSHLETTLRERFRDKVPRGFVTIFRQVAANQLHVKESHIERLRKWIKACQNGKRNTISSLREC